MCVCMCVCVCVCVYVCVCMCVYVCVWGMNITFVFQLPRTFVNLVQILDVTKLAPLSSPWCDLVHS